MKIGYTAGSKFDGDRKFYIETNGKEVFTHARLFILINALTQNEKLIYENGGWADRGFDFLYPLAIEDAIKLGQQGIVFIDQKDDTELKKFCERNKLMRKFNVFKQTLLNDFIKENGNS